MIYLPALIQDLGIILITAALVTLLFKKLRQPVVLGYLIAGLLVGRHVSFFPSVTDVESIKVWAEMGVIFLLFSLGLEFSFKKLTQVGKSASITAVVEIIFMLGIGYLTAQLLGWSQIDSMFLGGILSISSTTIIVRAFEELGLKGKNFVSLVFGVLIVEDLVAILLLVLLSSVAVTQTLSGTELALSSLRLGFFLLLWFVLGIYLLPIFLRKISSHLSDETMLVVSIGLCLMMVMIATRVGFSPALGAFVMGSLLAETREGHRIERLLVPVRDLFAAIFFVSVGMMIDLRILYEYFWIILLMSVVTIIGKILSSGIGALLSGRSLHSSIQAGMSLAQIGEFSFIIATLGLTLKVTSDFLYPIAVSVSAVTTFTTPYLIKYSDPFYHWLDRNLPVNLKERLSRYELAVSSGTRENTVGLLWNEYGMKIILNIVVVVAIGLTMSQGIVPLFEKQWPNLSSANIVFCVITLLISAPFLWAIVVAPPKHRDLYKPETVVQLRRLQFGLSIIRFIIGVSIVVFIISEFVSLSAVATVVLLALSVLGLYFSRYSEPLYQAVEKRFISNLTEKERDELARSHVNSELAPWNATLSEYTVSPDSSLIAKTFQDAAIKERYGVTIAMLQRGETRILAPGREHMLLPYDRIFAIGTDEQLAELKKVIEVRIKKDSSPTDETFGLKSVLLKEKSIYINKTIRECGIREAVHGLIVGIERHGKRILNPDSGLTLQPQDLIWIVGNLRELGSLRETEKN